MQHILFSGKPGFRYSACQPGFHEKPMLLFLLSFLPSPSDSLSRKNAVEGEPLLQGPFLGIKG